MESKIPPHPINFNIQRSIQSFTGRGDIIQSLHDSFHGKDKARKQHKNVLSQMTLLSGMGGIGKTETVRKYIQLYRKKYYHVIWMDATTYNKAITCFLKLAPTIPIKSNRTTVQGLVDDIYSFICTKPCLIIFDNASVFSPPPYEGHTYTRDIYKLLPWPSSFPEGLIVPKIIVTSQNRNLCQLPVIQLEGLTLDECYSLLLKELKFQDVEKNWKIVQDIATNTGCHPLIVQQVISLIRGRSQQSSTSHPQVISTIEQFISESMYSDIQFLLIRPAESTTGKTIFETVNNILHEVKSLCETFNDYYDRLTIMALLYPEKIPIILLESLFEGGSKQFNEVTDKVTHELNMLHEFNVITIYEGFCKIPRVTQTIINSHRSYLGQSFIKIVTLRFYDFLEVMTITAKYFNDVLDNGVAFLEKTMEERFEEHHLKLQGLLASKLIEVGRKKLATTIFEQLLANQLKKLGRTHAELRSTINMAKGIEATKHFEEVIQAQIAKLRDPVVPSWLPQTLLQETDCQNNSTKNLFVTFESPAEKDYRQKLLQIQSPSQKSKLFQEPEEAAGKDIDRRKKRSEKTEDQEELLGNMAKVCIQEPELVEQAVKTLGVASFKDSEGSSTKTQEESMQISSVGTGNDDSFSGKRGDDLQNLLMRKLSEQRIKGDSFPFHTLIWKLLPNIYVKTRFPDRVAKYLQTSNILTQFQVHNIKRQRLNWNKTEILFGVILKDEAVSSLISAMVATENSFILELIEEHTKNFDMNDPLSNNSG